MKGCESMILRTHYLEQAIPFVDQDLIKIFTGIRRSGKTVLMKQMRDWLLDHGRHPEQVLLFNMESLQTRRKAQEGRLYDEILSYAKGIPKSSIFSLMKSRIFQTGRFSSIPCVWILTAICILPVPMPPFFPMNWPPAYPAVISKFRSILFP